MADGPLWKDQRKFMMRSLREMGIGKASIEVNVLEEVGHGIDHLKDRISKRHADEVVRIDKLFDYPCLNVIWRIASGSRFDYEDSQIANLIGHVEAFTMNPLLGPLTAVKNLKHIPPFSRYYKDIKQHMDTFKDYLMKYVSKEDQVHGGYIELFEREMQDNQSEFYGKKQLVVSVEDFFTGGSGTLSKTLAFCIYYLSRHPKAQERARDEVKRAILESQSQQFSLELKDKIPFTESCMLESQRMGSVLPIAPPRISYSKDVKVGSHVIPKGIPVQMNLYALHHDKDHWIDPDNFRPERFLDENGVVKQDDWLQPFGYGELFQNIFERKALFRQSKYFQFYKYFLSMGNGSRK